MHYSISSSFQKNSLMYDTDISSISTELKTKMIHASKTLQVLYQRKRSYSCLTISLNLYWYLAFPLLSFISLEKMTHMSNRKRWRSRPFLISCLGSHTVNWSCRNTSPRASGFSSSPSNKLRCMASLALLGTFIITSSPSFDWRTRENLSIELLLNAS